MKRIYIYTVFILAALILFSACEKILFREVGELESQEIGYDFFNAIHIAGVFDVELKSGPDYKVRIEQTEKFIDRVTSTLKSDTLLLEDQNPFDWYPDYPRPKISITFPSLSKAIHTDYPVRIFTTDTLTLPRLTLRANGKTGEYDLTLKTGRFDFITGSDNYGSYTFSGKTGYLDLRPRASSVVNAENLVADSCFVYNNSIADCRVNVVFRLVAKLDTYGNVFYKGNPGEVVIQEESGEGRVLPLEN